MKVKDLMSNMGIIPVDFCGSPNKILVIDVNYLPSEVKKENIVKLEKKLRKKYSRNILLIDTSKQNMQGSSPSINPVYTI